MYPTDNQIKSFKLGDNVFIRESKIKISPRLWDKPDNHCKIIN